MLWLINGNGKELNGNGKELNGNGKRKRLPMWEPCPFVKRNLA